MGPGLRDHGGELLRFAGIDASVGLLRLALSQLMLIQRIYLLATWLKVALVVLSGSFVPSRCSRCWASSSISSSATSC